MTRQAIDEGGWFDLDRAAKWDEETYWNGNNHISRATGSQWEHETLYHTASGNWVLHRTSQWQGSVPAWEQIDSVQAAEWLIRNEHDVPAELDGVAASREV